MNRLLIAIAGGVISGFGLGALTAYATLEAKKQRETDEQIKAMAGAYEQALNLIHKKNEAEVVFEITQDGREALEETRSTEVQLEDHLQKFVDEHPSVPEQRTQENAYEVQNDYHKAISAVETPIEQFVEGGVNDYGISYLEEEEYLDEDGRFKGKIDIMMDGMNPVFIMDGEQIDDWDQRLGDSILVDFYKLVPPGVDRILYVRNHRTDEDYEVVWVTP